MDLVDALEQLEGPRAAGIDRANTEAVRRLDRSVPLLVDVAPAGTLIPDLSGRMLLHCGPAIEWAAVCDPLRRSMRAAAVAEGWAGTVEQADRILADGSVKLQPAYRYDTVMPMASAIGPSAPVFAVDNRDGGTRAFAPVNQGPGETAWFGRETPAAIARLEFLRDVGGPMLRNVLDSSGPIDIFALAAQGVQIGDDVHMRTQGTTNLMIRNLLPQIAALPDSGRIELAQYLSGNHLFFLNLAMAAAKSAAMWAEQVEGSSIVTMMCRNGTSYAIKLAGSKRGVHQRSTARRRGDVLPRLRSRDERTRHRGQRDPRAGGTRRRGSCRLTGGCRVPAGRDGRRDQHDRADGVHLRRRKHSVQAAHLELPGNPSGGRRTARGRAGHHSQGHHGNPAREFRRRPDRCRGGHRSRRVFPRCPAGLGGRRIARVKASQWTVSCIPDGPEGCEPSLS